MVRWHNQDKLNRMYINIGDGKKAAMPRYYKDKVYDQATRSEIAGFQKGKIELETIIAVESYQGNASYARDKNQATKAAFNKMRHQSRIREKY